jgi:hypothetical protein
MIDISSAIITVMQRLKKSGPGNGIRMLTYKRDRHVTIIRTDDNHYIVTQRGFENRKFTITDRELKKTLKTLLRREFPRSRKVRISQVP